MHIFSGGSNDNFQLFFFPRGNFPWGEKFPGSELVSGNYTLQDIALILICLAFSFPFQFYARSGSE